MIHFTHGIVHENFYYGWHKKELYRLPSQSGLSHYGFKKLNQITVGNQKGYRLKKSKFSLNRLKEMTSIIDVKVYTHKSKHTPF